MLLLGEMAIPRDCQQVQLDMRRDAPQKRNFGQETETVIAIVDLTCEHNPFERFLEGNTEGEVRQTVSWQDVTTDTKHGRHADQSVDQTQPDFKTAV